MRYLQQAGNSGLSHPPHTIGKPDFLSPRRGSQAKLTWKRSISRELPGQTIFCKQETNSATPPMCPATWEAWHRPLAVMEPPGEMA